jgi:hypothetical protein
MHKIFLTIFAAAATAFAVLAQTTASKPAQQLFQEYMAQAVQYADAYPREKAYLHLDNSSYYIGDTIWFKAYVTTPVKEQLSTLSRPLYVELIEAVAHNGREVLVPEILSVKHLGGSVRAAGINLCKIPSFGIEAFEKAAFNGRIEIHDTISFI